METFTVLLIFAHLTLNLPSVIVAQDSALTTGSTADAQDSFQTRSIPTSEAGITTTAIPCGGRRTDSSGYIYDSWHNSSPVCTWTIEVPPDHCVVLSFYDALIRSDGGDCDSDYMKIYDGHPWQSKVLGKLCHYTTNPPSYSSSSNVMTLELVHQNSYGYYSAWYYSSSLSSTAFPTTAFPTTAFPTTAIPCGGRRTDSSGYIYDSWHYPSSRVCTWTIEVPYGHVEIHLNSVSMGNNGRYCNSQSLTIYDGYPWNSAVLGTVCQYTSQVFYSSSNVMTLQLVHHNSNGYFSFWYYSSSLSSAAPTTSAPTTSVPTAASSAVSANLCGGTRTDPSGYIYDSWNSPSSLVCTWTIEVPSDCRVQFYFNSLYMDNNGGYCNSTYLTIYAGHRWNSDVLGKICGYTTQTFYSSSNVMTLELVRQSSYGYFSVWYYSSNLASTASTTAVPPVSTLHTTPSNACGGIRTGSSGNIYDDWHSPSSQVCTWRIEVPYGYYIHFYFSSLYMQNNGTDCNSDYVKIYNGYPWNSALLGTVCQNTGQLFYSSSNVLTLELVHQSPYGYLSFWYYSSSLSSAASTTTASAATAPRMALRLVNGRGRCDGRVEILHSGQWGTVCDDGWDIKDAQVVCQQIGCGNALASNSSAAFGQGQGQIILDDVRCNGDERFLWDCPHSGLTAHNCGHNEDAGVVCSGVENTNIRCGGILTNLHGSISLDSNISSEPDSCVWYISVANNYRIHLSFQTFIMKNAQSCYSSSLSIHDGTPLGSTSLGDLCRTSTREFISSSNSISIVYSRADKAADLGFSATYYSTFSNNQNVSLSCHSDYMTARISQRYLESLEFSPNDIFLNDPQCRPRVVADWLEFHIPYESCLTGKQVENDTISYTNALFTDSANTIVIYRKKIGLTLICRLYRDTVVEGVYSADDFIKNTIVQYGLYSASLIFFPSSSFIYPVYEYPYYVQLNQHLYLQATLNTSDPSLVLFLHTCMASPDEFDFTRNVFYLIRDGCINVPDYRTYPSPSNNKLRFGFNAFSFLKRHSYVYIQCKLVVCKAGSANSRCSQGCTRRRRRAADAHRHEEVHVVVGPVQLKLE